MRITRKLSWLLVLLASPGLAWGQGVRIDNPAGPATRNVQNFLAPIGGASITVCTSGATGTPCSPLVPTSPVTLCTDSTCSVAAPNPFTADTNGNWGAWLLPGTYKVSITASGVTGQLLTVTLPITLTGSNAFTQPITAPAFVSSSSNPASTGFTRAASADSHCWRNAANTADLCLSKSAGDLLQWNNDTVGTLTAAQTLANKTLTTPTITSPTVTTPTQTGGTLDGFGFSHVTTVTTAVTNFGTAIGSQTLISSMPATGVVSLQFLIVQVTAGVGCSAATNSTTVNPVAWTAPGGTSESINPNSNFGFTGNGVVDTGSETFGASAFTNNGIQAIVAKSGTAVSFSVTSTLGSTGCSTVPQYQVFAKAIF